MKQKYQFTVGTHSIDYSNAFPLFDGKCVRSKDRLVSMVKFILNEIGYTFEPFNRPVPPILLNWQSIDKTFLRKWIIRLLQQIATIEWPILRLSYLDLDGFCFYMPSTGKKYKLVHVDLTADGYHYDCTVTLDQLSSVVQRFFNSYHTNKKILIN